MIFHAEALRLIDAVRARLSSHGADATGNIDALVSELKKLCSKVSLKVELFHEGGCAYRSRHPATLTLSTAFDPLRSQRWTQPEQPGPVPVQTYAQVFPQDTMEMPA